MCQAERRAQVFAQLQPVLLGYGHENVDYFGIELGARAALYLSPGVRQRQSFAIRPVADHGIKRIRDSEDARPERDVVVFQAARVSGAVKKFLVRQHDFRGIAEEWDANEPVVANLAV